VLMTEAMSMAMQPAPAGLTKIEVEYDEDDSAETIATLIAAAVTAETDFHAKVDECDPARVIIMCKTAGSAQSPQDGTMTNATGFDLGVQRGGFLHHLGSIEGDVELALTEDLADVTSQQTGTQITAALRTGKNIDSISLTLQESDLEKIHRIIENSGSGITPDGGTYVAAWGSEDQKAFGNVLSGCGALVLHPVRKADNDLTEDICFWRTYPLLTGLNISGESARTISVDFRVFPDTLLIKQVRQVVFGDHTQNFLVEPTP
jgi:hypothetical protein